MGNRAVITTAPYSPNKLGIYVHWNGGRASVEGFLQACEELGYRTPDSDPAYGMARLAQAIGVYFGGELSLGVGLNKNLDTDNGDAGTYLIKGWKIVGRKFEPAVEEIDAEKTAGVKDRIIKRTRAFEAIEEDA